MYQDVSPMATPTTTPKKNPCRGVSQDEAALMVQTGQAKRADYLEAGFEPSYLDSLKRPVAVQAAAQAATKVETVETPDTVEEITEPEAPTPPAEETAAETPDAPTEEPVEDAPAETMKSGKGKGNKGKK